MELTTFFTVLLIANAASHPGPGDTTTEASTTEDSTTEASTPEASTPEAPTPEASTPKGTKTEGTYTYHLGIKFEELGGIRCGAAVVSPHFAITAAHCVYPGRSAMKVVLSNGDPIAVDSVMIHEKYEPFSGKNDIALIQVDASNPFKNETAPMMELADTPLPNFNQRLNSNSAPSKAFVTGYKFNPAGDDSRKVSRVAVPLYSDDVCRSAYGNFYMQDTMMCAGKVQSQSISCGGDFGGPVIFAEGTNKPPKLIGIVTNNLASSQGCGTTGPAVYVKITAFKKWIEHNLIDMSNKKK